MAQSRMACSRDWRCRTLPLSQPTAPPTFHLFLADSYSVYRTRLTRTRKRRHNRIAGGTPYVYSLADIISIAGTLVGTSVDGTKIYSPILSVHTCHHCHAYASGWEASTQIQGRQVGCRLVVQISCQENAGRRANIHQGIRPIAPFPFHSLTNQLGQWAASRADLFPSLLCEKMGSLHSRGKPHSLMHTKQVIERAFERPFDEVFEVFDENPIGVGAIAQVGLPQASLGS